MTIDTTTNLSTHTAADMATTAPMLELPVHVQLPGPSLAALAALPAVPAHGWMPGHEPPSHDEIARGAYALYEARGRENGWDIEDWLAAEELLRHRIQQ